MAALNGFDTIAKIYDPLARIVFGWSIRRSQLHFINHIPQHANLLILGGGTGWILNEIVRINPSCRIYYVDASAKMIALSKKRIKGYQSIHFVHGTEQNIDALGYFDAVITNFYLDLFKQDELYRVIPKILSALKQDCRWIATDFVDGGKWWQIVLLKSMYFFFKTVSNIDAIRLPDWNLVLNECGMVVVDRREFYHGFIKTLILKRTIV